MRNDVLLRGVLLGLAVPVLLLTGGLGSGPASAHAALVGSDPKAGSTLAVAPTTITLRFNEAVGNPAYVAVTAPDGSKVEVTDVKAVDQNVTATVEDADMRGRYSAAYRIMSTDGHPVTGTVAYEVTAGRTVGQVEAPQEQSFLHRHRGHLLWGILAAAVAVALLLAPLRRRDDADRA
ncbi:copper resistance CopC family protein [Aeromicrobium chenweiae]|uniref:copper resistance CopC family protein n=1 Tax=Aeromicrobium chenweiae TaxID=2079793 RepID=UPI00131EF18B|nr:copper resistance CopC family protein [Aeromicrobium chenweiae]